MTYETMMKKSKDFYDTVDFMAFIYPDVHRIKVRDLMDHLKEYYDENHPEMIPPEFEGCFFCYTNETEFVDYLRRRYGWDIQEEVTVEYYIRL